MVILPQKAVILKKGMSKKVQQYYLDKGYYFVDGKIEVDVKDLLENSHAEIFIKCDYCGEIYKRDYKTHNNNRKIIKKDACHNCRILKRDETNLLLYNVKNFPQLNRTDFNIVKEAYDKLNLVLLETEFINNAIPMKCYCIYHPDIIQYKSYNGVNSGRGCRYCQYDNLRGENNWNWKGGITSEYIKARTCQEYTNWRIDVFKHDYFTCQCCGYKGIDLNAHHIKNFNDYEELRYDLDNGITLCEKCHRKFHSEYGNKNNNEEQLNEFILSSKIISR